MNNASRNRLPSAAEAHTTFRQHSSPESAFTDGLSASEKRQILAAWQHDLDRRMAVSSGSFDNDPTQTNHQTLSQVRSAIESLGNKNHKNRNNSEGDKS